MNGTYFGWDRKEKKLVNFSTREKLEKWCLYSFRRTPILRNKGCELSGISQNAISSWAKKNVDLEDVADDYKPMDDLIKMMRHKVSEEFDRAIVNDKSTAFERYWLKL